MKTLASESKVPINPQVPESLKNRLESQADQEMCSQSAIVRKALDEYCEEK